MKKVVFLMICIAFLSCGTDSHLIEGEVSDADGIAIDHVLVQVMGTDLNSKTDANGKFRINTRNRGEELIFTHPDFEMHRIEIGDSKEFSVQLKEKKSQAPQK